MNAHKEINVIMKILYIKLVFQLKKIRLMIIMIILSLSVENM